MKGCEFGNEKVMEQWEKLYTREGKGEVSPEKAKSPKGPDGPRSLKKEKSAPLAEDPGGEGKMPLWGPQSIFGVGRRFSPAPNRGRSQ